MKTLACSTASCQIMPILNPPAGQLYESVFEGGPDYLQVDHLGVLPLDARDQIHHGSGRMLDLEDVLRIPVDRRLYSLKPPDPIQVERPRRSQADPRAVPPDLRDQVRR